MKNIFIHIASFSSYKYLFLILTCLCMMGSMEVESSRQEVSRSTIIDEEAKESIVFKSSLFQKVEINGDLILHTCWHVFKFALLGLLIFFGIKSESSRMSQQEEQLKDMSSLLFIAL